MSKKKFKAESKQLLDLMIHSIYSNKEVFLRELLSNAADALNKRYFYDLKNGGTKDDEYKIQIKLDSDSRSIIIQDSGIGMSADELETNLGTIAHSGTKEFLDSIKDSDDKVSGIGQFGVGFYSSFIVSDKVVVESCTASKQGSVWQSNGVEAYDIEESSYNEIGTKITLHLREGEEFDNFLNSYTIKQLIKKYSDYIQFPIYLEEVKTISVDDDGNKLETEETVIENNIVNSMKAIWKKNKNEVTVEDKEEFFKNKYFAFEKPALIIDGRLEGTVEFDLMLFIPSMKPFDYYNGSYKKGLDLYSKEILIEENADYLIPDYFNFVKGVVDCADINLNISREMLQKDHVVTKLTKGIENKIVTELKKMLKNNREEYVKLWENFGREITYGVYQDFGVKKDSLKDLLIYKSSIDETYLTLEEYVNKNSESDVIYYVAGKSIELINKLPAMEPFIEKGIEVLYFTNDVDEFAISLLGKYNDKEFKSISNADLDLNEDKEAIEEKSKSNEHLLKVMKECLKDDVSDIKLTDVLKTSASRLVSKDNLSIEMEKTLMQMPGAEGISANKVLELNVNHPIFEKLVNITNDEKIEKFAYVLYQQARLVEGLSIVDPVEYVSITNELLI